MQEQYDFNCNHLGIKVNLLNSYRNLFGENCQKTFIGDGLSMVREVIMGTNLRVAKISFSHIAQSIAHILGWRRKLRNFLKIYLMSFE